MIRSFGILATTALTLTACADAPESSGESPEDTSAVGSAAEAAIEPGTGPAVEIVSPMSGDTVQGPDLTVVIDVTGMSVVAAGDQTPNSGHHHLFLDADLTPGDQPIPAEEGRIIHMGDGSTSYTFTGVPSGDHRVIAVVGDWQHVPLQPWVVDTVQVTVR